ncbi:DS-domain-containing protein [Rhizodiscina lignyota]|uniref:deoxyhypusine synthase n=1 Tax=Rhizodiscina lignyota TaxID=1504668 RepID=A0A9P4M311_9PEZI|nr:DS-domain-containing protein [Rhizodiscina lignyota]
MSQSNGGTANAAPSLATDAVLMASEPIPEGTRTVSGIDFNKYADRSIPVEELLAGISNMGFQGSSIGEAIRIINDMRSWRDPETHEGTTIFLGYTSNMISSGLRDIFRYLVQHKHVSAIVTTAGGVEEDFIKCLGPTYHGSFTYSGVALRDKGWNRIGNLIVPNENYTKFEDWILPIFDKMLEEQESTRLLDEDSRVRWTPSKVIHRLGKEINNEESVYYWAYKNNIPVFCPALTDGSLGDMLYFHTFKTSPKMLSIDIVEDIRKINSLANWAKRGGMIILGGGVVKHHIANAFLMRNGAEHAVYINTAQEFDGSDAGARPDEAVSWGKIRKDGDSVKVYAEATVAFPLIVAGTFAKPSRDSAPTDSSRGTTVETAEPPPLLFSPRSPSPPSFSPQHSPAPTYHPPTDPQHFQHMASSQPQAPPEDVDMSMSLTLPPQGQNHDRDDGRMEVMDADTNEVNITEVVEDSSGNTAGSHSPSDSDSDDAMDTTPDGVIQPAEATGPPADVIPPPPPDVLRELSTATTGNAATTNASSSPQTNGGIPPPPLRDHSRSPTSSRAPSPPPEHNDSNQNRESSDDDDSAPSWHPIHEDTSIPDEREMKEIEEQTEHSAHDHEHWEAKTFTKLEDPEFSPGPTGKIEWLVEHYNGTKENPNHELVMKSPRVNIGGHEWNIKFYPRGNDTEFLSVYVECASMETSADSNTSASSSNPSSSNSFNKTSSEADTDSEDLPLPVLPGHTSPRSHGVSAQVSVVLYNPAEPRVNFWRPCTHRFTPKQTDWGFTRFHGPYYEIQTRHHGQRQALLRNDQLAFIAYIRIVEDTTGCLWEHPLEQNPWDSFAMTGVQGLGMGRLRPNAPAQDGNFISAIAGWMMLMPFREMLYEATQIVPDPSAKYVSLEEVIDALAWYGVDMAMDHWDVVQVQEALRTKLQAELEDTHLNSALDRLFGPMKDRRTCQPTYRVSPKKFKSMQDAVVGTEGIVASNKALPYALQIEIERQEFVNTGERKWRKVVDKMALDDHISVNDVRYTLHSFVVHKEGHQSNQYLANVRPLGPNGKWYAFEDTKLENRVVCLTKRQAIAANEGVENPSQSDERKSVAYLVTYLMDDVAEDAFDGKNEQVWDVPAWLEDEAKLDRDIAAENDMAIDKNGEAEGDEKVEDMQAESEPTTHEFQIIDSRVFLQHYGPGTFDVFEKGSPIQSEFVYDIFFPSNVGPKGIKEKIASVVPGVEDPRQCRLWIMDSLAGTELRPNLLSASSFDLSDSKSKGQEPEWTVGDLAARTEERRLWLHVIDKKDLPPPPPPPPETNKQEGSANSNPSSSQALPDGIPGGVSVNTGLAIVDVPIDALLGGNMPIPTIPAIHDTLMSDADISPEEQELARRSGGPVTIIEIPALQGSNGAPPPPGTSIVQAAPMGIPGMDIAVPNAIVLSSGRGLSGTTSSSNDEIFFFLKVFDAEKQTMIPKGSFIESRKARLDRTVARLLEVLPDTDSDSLPEIYEEEDLVKAFTRRRRKTFAQEDLHDTCVLIAAFPISPENKLTLRAEGKATTPQQYLQFESHRRNFPHLYQGTFTFDYFSSEYYSGDMLAGLAHGAGTKISFDGTQYTGEFVLDDRHGQGSLTYSNGDTYTGSFASNQRSGHGTFTEASTTNRYEGNWKGDKKFGEGVTYWAQAQEAERICRICWDEGQLADAAFWDCGHVVACLGCAKRVDTCPVCRKRVGGAMRLFFVS